MKKFIYRFFVLSTLVMSCFFLMLQSKSVKDHFSEMFTQKLQEQTGLLITVKDWSITYPLAIQIDQITCETPSIQLNQIYCHIPLSSLLFQKFSLDTLIVDEIIIDENFKSEGESSLPPSFEIANLQIKKLVINQIPLSITGGVKWDSQEEVFSSVLHLNKTPVHFTLSKKHLFAITSQGSLDAGFDFSGTLFKFENLNLESDHFSLKGEGALDLKNFSLSSNLQLAAFDKEIPCSLSGTLAAPIFQTHYNDFELTATTSWKEGVLLASIDLTSPQINTVHFETELFSPQKLWPYTLSCQAKKGRIQSEGAWKMDLGGFALFVDSLSGEYSGYPFALKETAMIRNRECSPLFFSFAGGTIHTTLDYIADNINMTTKAKNLPSELFELWLPPLPFTSNVEMEAFLYGPPTSLNGKIQLDLDRIKVLDETYVKLPPLQAHCHATLKDEELKCSGTIIGAGPYPMSLSGSLPFKCQLWPPKVTIDQKSPFKAEITASGEISPYLHLFYSDTTNITGQASIALSAEGTLETPQLSGELKLENGTFESYILGTLFENINAKIVGRGSQIFLTKFSADTNGAKNVTANGSLSLDATQFYPFTVSVNTQHTPLFQLDQATVVTSGPLLLQGNMHEALISGDLTVEQADFEIPKQLSPSIKELDVTYINQPKNEEPPTTYTVAAETYPIALDVRLSAPKGIHLTGKDLFTEWKGEAFVKGSALSPQLFGKVEAIKGEQLINGKMFYLKQGSVTFSGNYTDKTTLYVIAEHEIDDIAAEIVLKGAVNNPLISFRSNPPLSQQEILSLILFNKTLGEVDALQGTENNPSFAALNSAGDETGDLMGKLRNSLGIDRLEFSHSGHNGQNDISVKVGKYVTPGILVLVNKSMTTDAKSLAISANLVKSFKLQAEIDEDANSHLLLKWKHDY